MTTVPVLWVSWREEILARGYADQGLLEAIFPRELWTPPDPITYEHQEVRGNFPDLPGAVVCINARTHAKPEYVDRLQRQLKRLDWSVLILCGDEEWEFPWAQFPESETRKTWCMQPIPPHQAVSGRIPGGWYPHTRDWLASHRDRAIGRPLDWFFGGQVTHERRQECVAKLREMDGGELIETDGYLRGIPRDEYTAKLAGAKVVPCPSGPMTVDTARPLEAMEAGCVPIVDTLTPRGDDYDYWSLCFGPNPLRKIRDWDDLPGAIADEIAAWPHNSNRVWSWWQQWKRRIVHQLDAGVRSVSGSDRTLDAPDDQITVIIPTSPIPSHPSTRIIDQTIESVRAQLPRAEIIVVCDGVRPEQRDQTETYGAYLQTLLWKCNFEWHNVVPVVLDEWGHQANATRAALELVTTPLVLFVEHDTPLDGEIPWWSLCEIVGSGEANCVRFHHESHILPDHDNLFVDRYPRPVGLSDPLPLLRTVAWWQRPHLASTRFYRERIMPLFPAASRTMIEDRLYGVVWTDWVDHGESAWWDWRLYVYAPGGDSIKRSLHLDGREDQPKYEMRMD